MLTMTYTNTLAKTGEVLTEKVRVVSRVVGYELIEKWNLESYNYCQEAYRYEVIGFAPETGDDQEKLGIYMSAVRYYVADQDKYDR